MARAVSHPEFPRPIVAVLAGGRGSRLHGHKPTTPLHGRPLISYPLASARDAGLEAIVVAKRETQLPALGERVIYDEELTVHPLSGVLAALAEHPAVIAIACDMPFVPVALLRALAGHHDATVVARPGAFFQPFPALYSASCASTLHDALAAELSMQKTLARLRPTVLEAADLSAFGEPERVFFSVNTPADLSTAERWLDGWTARGE